MRLRLWVRLVCFFSACAVNVSSIGATTGNDAAFFDFLKNEDLRNQRVELEKKELKSQGINETTLRAKDRVDFEKNTLNIPENTARINAEMPAWLETTTGKSVPPSNAVAAGGNPNKAHIEKAQTLVFISTSMPSRSLKALFAEANGRDDIVFLIRGWTPPHYTKVIREIYMAMGWDGKSKKLPYQVNLTIEPRLFKAYKVTSVPVVLHKNSLGHWGILRGELSIKGSVAYIENEHFPKTPVGPLFQVAEPDVLELIKSKAASIDWAAKRNAVAAKASSVLRKGKSLPAAVESKSYFVDIISQVKEDVRMPDGQIIANAGAEVRPLAYMTLSKRYIVFNPNRKKEIDLVRKWLAVYPSAVVMATSIPDVSPPIHKQLNHAVWPLQPEIADKMGFISTPSVAEQEGQLLKITTEKVSE